MEVYKYNKKIVLITADRNLSLRYPALYIQHAQ